LFNFLLFQLFYIQKLQAAEPKKAVRNKPAKAEATEPKKGQAKTASIPVKPAADKKVKFYFA
jgi:hypothetical protein